MKKCKQMRDPGELNPQQLGRSAHPWLLSYDCQLCRGYSILIIYPTKIIIVLYTQYNSPK